jgi:hypothetical protein
MMSDSERQKKVVVARSEATCLDAGVPDWGKRTCVLQASVMARRRGNLMRLLHGVYPERRDEILRFAQNDRK